MFDDVKTAASAPTNLPVEPDDIFAGVDKGEGVGSPPVPAAAPLPDALSKGLLKKKDETLSPSSVEALKNLDAVTKPQVYQTSGPVLGKVLIVLIVLVVAGGLGFGAWWLYGTMKERPPSGTNDGNIPKTTTDIIEQPPPAVVTIPTSTDIPASMQTDAILFGENVDTDKDGLDDVREREIGTNSSNVDTDSDRLNDGDEVIIWKTDPLNPDTDGDSYQDGSEVQNGYNPLGPGKLFNIPTTSPSS